MLSTDNTMDRLSKLPEDKVDRISEMPEYILHEILSCLSPKEAARTSVLSKKWRDIETRNPYLVFKVDDFFKESRRGSGGRKRKKIIDHEENIKEFVDYVESRLQYFSQHKPSIILKFHLMIQKHYNGLQTSYWVDPWLKQVMFQGIKYLHLSVWEAGLYSYRIPQLVFNSYTLVKLALYFCNLSAARGNIQLPNLQKLEVGCEDVDEDFIKHLISGCPLLQLLHIERSLRLSNLQVTGLPCLKHVKLFNCQRLANVEIQSPNLQTFIYVGNQRMQCDFSLAPSNDTLNQLMLQNVVVNPGWLQQQVSGCKELTLDFISGIDNIEISNPKLRKLEIQNCLAMTKMVKIDCPNLDSLNFFWNTLPFDSAEDNFKLRNIHLHFCVDIDWQYSLWLQKIEGFFNYFSLNKKLIKVAIFHDGHEDVIILDGLTELALPILHDYKKLILKPRVQISSVQSSNDLKYFIHCILFLPRISALHVTSAHGNHNFSQMLYEMLSTMIAEAACCDEPERLTWWQGNLCSVTKSSTHNISAIRSSCVPAALRPFQSGPYQITRIQLKMANEAT